MQRSRRRRRFWSVYPRCGFAVVLGAIGALHLWHAVFVHCSRTGAGDYDKVSRHLDHHSSGDGADDQLSRRWQSIKQVNCSPRSLCCTLRAIKLRSLDSPRNRADPLDDQDRAPIITTIQSSYRSFIGARYPAAICFSYSRPRNAMRRTSVSTEALKVNDQVRRRQQAR